MRFFFLAFLLLAGCAHKSDYSAADVGHEQKVRKAVVQSVREVVIESQGSAAGAATGAIAGGIAGSTAGQGKGSAVASILGSVLGGLGGSALEEAMNRKQGVELTVKFDSGEISSFVQEAGESFRPGERVQVAVSADGKSRVFH